MFACVRHKNYKAHHFLFRLGSRLDLIYRAHFVLGTDEENFGDRLSAMQLWEIPKEFYPPGQLRGSALIILRPRFESCGPRTGC
jgi:hypothetical protein